MQLGSVPHSDAEGRSVVSCARNLSFKNTIKQNEEERISNGLGLEKFEKKKQFAVNTILIITISWFIELVQLHLKLQIFKIDPLEIIFRFLKKNYAEIQRLIIKQTIYL